jgi:hypothetical protein
MFDSIRIQKSKNEIDILDGDPKKDYISEINRQLQ